MIDTCICCGEIIPEGRFVCYKCESSVNDAEGVYNRLISEITYKDNRPYGLFQNKNNKFVVFVNGMQIYCDTEEKVNHLANLHKNEVITIRRL